MAQSRLINIFILMIALSFCAGCVTKLAYKSEFDDKKKEYYETSFKAEYKVVQANVEKVEKEFLTKLDELCYILYTKDPSQRDQFIVLKANLKLNRLKKEIKDYQRLMNELSSLSPNLFLYPDLAEKPLSLRFQGEREVIGEFTDYFRELRVRLNQLDSFRKQTEILKGNPEESIERVTPDLLILQNDFKVLLYKDMVQKFSYVGQAIQKDRGFTFTVQEPPNEKIDEIDRDKRELQSRGYSVTSISSYSYNFDDGKGTFDEAISNLKESLKNFKTTAEDFQRAMKERGGTIASRQFEACVKIADQKLNNIDKTGKEAVKLLEDMVQSKKVTEEFWNQTSKEKDNFDASLSFYEEELYKLSELAKKSLDTGEKGEAASLVHMRLSILDKEFNQASGLNTTGSSFLSTEWQEKVSFKATDRQLDELLQKSQAKIQESLKPLLETAKVRTAEKGKRQRYVIEKGWIECER